MKERKQMLGMFFVIFALAIIGIWGGKQLYFLFQEKPNLSCSEEGVTKCVDNKYYQCIAGTWHITDCNIEIPGKTFCKGKDVYQVIKKGLCIPDIGCITETTSKLVEVCDYACKEGVCIVKEGFIGEAYCDDNKVVQNYQYEDGTVVVKLLEDCSSKGLVCKEGKCVKEQEEDKELILSLVALIISITTLVIISSIINLMNNAKWKS